MRVPVTSGPGKACTVNSAAKGLPRSYFHYTCIARRVVVWEKWINQVDLNFVVRRRPRRRSGLICLRVALADVHVLRFCNFITCYFLSSSCTL